ncbi:MAG: YnbE family lipoprotein [Desulfobulbus sp.]|uniref:YnbE family lipoprotein n=1 Tax=uncultured Desulfobulbus sp. TaxID=239745 RepID=UPI001B56160C|nr:YnbE family lipoprotein [uncultured Desulfobulbus sp.]MBP7518486.1 YnbE family lipoprotein [Desulfobulbus sp.]
MLRTVLTGAAVLLLVAACTPTVKVAPPDEPITINLNVKIEHEIRVKVEKELDSVINQESGLF